jgi:hypothetical protein
VSRTLSDDFEDEDSPGGSLDLDTGSSTNHAGAAGQSSYDAGGIDFDDEFGDDGPKGDLQLDLPEDSPAALRSKGPPPSSPSLKPHGGMSAPPQSGGAGGVPSRAPAPVLSQQPPASRPSGGFAAGGASSHEAAPPSSRSMPAGSESGHGPASGHGPSAGGAPAAAVQSLAPAGPPAPPSAAAVIAKYPAPPAKVIHAPMYAVRVVMRQLELRTDLDSLRRRRSPDVPLYEAALKAYDARTFRLGVVINCALFTVATVIFFLPVILRFVRAD